MNYISYEDLSAKQQAQVISGSGYDKEQLEFENPLFIADYDFKEYAQELAEDIGAINEVDNWPYTCIDWEHAAQELSYDYSSVEIDGTNYLFRSW